MTTDLFNYLLEASICQGVFYLFYRIFLHKETFFVFNRAYILAVLALSVVLPLIEVPVERQMIYLPERIATNTTAAPEINAATLALTTTVEPANTLTLQDCALYGYISICLLMGIRLLYQIGFLVYIRLTGRIHLYKNYKLVYTQGKLPTSSFFGWLFWDNTQVLQPEEKELIIRHESVHIEQHHTWDNLFLQLVKVCFWFNPLVYLFGKSLQEVHEYLADRGVVREYNKARYTRLLIEQSLAELNIALVHSFKGSPVHKRIAIIQAANHPTTARTIWKMGLSVVVAAGICYLQACQPREAAEPGLAGESDGANTYWLAAHGIVESSHRFKEGEYMYGHYPKPDVDDYAYPVGGFNPFRNYIQDNLRETHTIKPAGIRKKVFVQFTVDKEGYIRNPKVLPGMGLGPGYDEEAIRVIANGPKWVPARKDGKRVEASMVEAVIFGQRGGFSRFGAKYKRVCAQRTTGGPVPVEGVNNLIHKLTASYPEEAREQHIEGMVVVGFTVQPDGKAANFEVIQPIHPALDREALQVAQVANVSWKPAMKNGKAQASKVLLSFGFFLND